MNPGWSGRLHPESAASGGEDAAGAGPSDAADGAADGWLIEAAASGGSLEAWRWQALASDSADPSQVMRRDTKRSVADGAPEHAGVIQDPRDIRAPARYRRAVLRGDDNMRLLRRDALHGVIGWAVLVAVFAGVLVTARAVSPDAIESGLVSLSPPCPTQKLLHRPCPTCGMTRGFAALAHGRWDEALRHNRGAPVALAGWVAVLALGSVGLVRSIHAYRRVSPRRTT